MKSFDNLPIQERTERAQVVRSLMENSTAMDKYAEILRFDKNPDNKKEVDKLAVTLPPRLSKVLRAVQLIRRHYLSWCWFKAYPGHPRPLAVLEFVLQDKLLTFFLFWCEAIKAIHLNPNYPFLICDKAKWSCNFEMLQCDDEEEERYSYLYHIHTKFDDSHITDSVISMWLRLEKPGKHTSWGTQLSDVEKRLTEGNYSSQQGSLNIGYQFFKVAQTFDLSCFKDASANEKHAENITLNMDEFVLKCSAAVAFDDSNYNTLEIVHQLFPQFPELVQEISKHYVLSSRIPRDIESREKYQILGDVFGPIISYDCYDERTSLRNQSILSMIKSHPDLYVRWAVEPKLRILYRKLIDPVSLYD